MDTDQLIELITVAQSREFVDWRPVVKQIELGFQLDTPSETHGWTLLQWAIEHGHNQAAHFAIARGASINAIGTGKFACTPLDIAVRKGNDKFVDMFLRHGGIGRLPATSKRMELIKKGKDTIRELVENSRADSFGDAVRHFEGILGVKPKRDKLTGVTRFRKVSLVDVLSLSGKKNEQIAQVVPEFSRFSIANRECGAILYGETWLGTSLKKSDLVLAPIDSDIKLLTALTAFPGSPLCGNHVFFDALLKLYELQEYRVLSINEDALVLHFVEDIGAPGELAKEAIQLFPFLRDYHTSGAGEPDEIDVAAIVADDIRSENAVHIIYHAF